MGKNSKPILSVLVDEEKKEKFADLARRNKYSMGWLLNDCIDRMLELDSIDIYGEPARSPQLSNTSTLPIDTNNIENLVNTYIDKLDIENLVNTSIANLDLKSIIAAQLPRQNSDEDIERIVRGQIEPLADLIGELETYTQSQFAAVRSEIEKALEPIKGQLDMLEERQVDVLPKQPSFVDSTSDLTGKSKTTADGDTKTWGEFFKMVNIEALTASEAQKKENIDIRTQQIAQGILAAKEQGLGEWAVKVAGRSFVRVGD